MPKNKYFVNGTGSTTGMPPKSYTFTSPAGYGQTNVVSYSYPIADPTPTPTPVRVLFTGMATFLYWSDGSTTVSICQDGDVFSEETGVLNCIAQKFVPQLNKKVSRLLEFAEVL
jgi:hypothetical protein